MRQPLLLLIDDDSALTSQLEELFRLEGYRVLTAPDGLEALQFLEAELTPDLILLDMQMAGVNGWDFGAELRQLELHIPILVMTADENPQRCAQQVGAMAYLAKPFELDQLLLRIERLLTRSQRRAA